MTTTRRSTCATSVATFPSRLIRRGGTTRVAGPIVVNVACRAGLSLGGGDERNNSVLEIEKRIETVPAICMRSGFGCEPRAGYRRIMRVLDRYPAPITARFAGPAIERTPWLAEHLLSRGDEVVCHGHHWERPAYRAPEQQRVAIGNAVDVIKAARGERPIGRCDWRPTWGHQRQPSARDPST